MPGPGLHWCAVCAGIFKHRAFPAIADEVAAHETHGEGDRTWDLKPPDLPDGSPPPWPAYAVTVGPYVPLQLPAISVCWSHLTMVDLSGVPSTIQPAQMMPPPPLRGGIPLDNRHRPT